MPLEYEISRNGLLIVVTEDYTTVKKHLLNGFDVCIKSNRTGRRK